MFRIILEERNEVTSKQFELIITTFRFLRFNEG
jgi:hypothetical protein